MRRSICASVTFSLGSVIIKPNRVRDRIPSSEAVKWRHLQFQLELLSHIFRKQRKITRVKSFPRIVTVTSCLHMLGNHKAMTFNPEQTLSHQKVRRISALGVNTNLRLEHRMSEACLLWESWRMQLRK